MLLVSLTVSVGILVLLTVRTLAGTVGVLPVRSSAVVVVAKATLVGSIGAIGISTGGGLVAGPIGSRTVVAVVSAVLIAGRVSIAIKRVGHAENTNGTLLGVPYETGNTTPFLPQKGLTIFTHSHAMPTIIVRQLSA